MMTTGKDMAYLGAGLALSALLQDYDVSLPQPAESVTYDIGLTLWSKGGIRVRFTRRPGLAKT